MMHLLLAFLLTFQTRFSVVVKTPAGMQTYNDNQSERVQIELPTNRYSCSRLPLTGDDAHGVIMIACEENGVPAFILGGICRTDRPDENHSMGTVNVAHPGQPPIPVMFAIHCKTEANKTVL